MTAITTGAARGQTVVNVKAPSLFVGPTNGASQGGGAESCRVFAPGEPQVLVLILGVVVLMIQIAPERSTHQADH